MESISADIIIHLIDASDPEMYLKIFSVEKIIGDLKLQNSKIIYVFNKIDLGKNIDKKNIEEKFAKFTPVFISAKIKTGIKKLLEKIESHLGTFQNPQILPVPGSRNALAG